ncbi:MAG: enoyl-CoA hydratase-related protein [Candidatus Binatia bacterium]
MADDILFEEADGIATITLNRPEARNALSVGASNRLHEIWEAIDRSASIRAVILTSADCGTFCAGMDLKEAARIKQQRGEDVLTLIKDPMHQRMRRVRQPIVAAMTGHATAGGVLLSLNADLRVGLAGTRLGITEAKMGRGSPWAVPLVSMMPQPILMELVLTGELMPIERFQALGFVNYVEATPDAVRERARALAASIRDNAPLSVMAAKQAVLAAMNLGSDEAFERAMAIYAPVYASADAEEGPRAFAEKRKPLWRGK